MIATGRSTSYIGGGAGSPPYAYIFNWTRLNGKIRMRLLHVSQLNLPRIGVSPFTGLDWTTELDYWT